MGRAQQPWRAFDGRWFRRHQSRLVWALNHRLTARLMRWLLRIDHVPAATAICEIGPSHTIHARGDGEYVGTFSSGPVYAMRVYARAKALWWALHYWDALLPDRFPDWAFAQRLSFGFAVLTAECDAGNPGTTSVDGGPGISGAGTFGALRTSVGNFTSGTSTTIFGFRLQVNGTNWQQIIRGVFHFDTSALTAGATISSATFRLYCSALTDTLSIANAMCTVASNVTSDNTVANSDYQAMLTSTTEFADRYAWASWTTSAYNDIALNATGLAAISKTGVTKLGTRAAADLDNVEPSVSFVNGNKNEPAVEAADNAGTNEPQLEVVYSAGDEAIATGLGSQPYTGRGNALGFGINMPDVP